ncbi:MAG TPA: DNA polymerase III subunit delta [Ilumatobacteraceae bacterium]|nr:DNA polymerase III subunit delta [Ilumatobacteraceae bacterium]
MATHLLSGNDESVLRSAVHELVDELVGDGDRAMMVDEFDGDEYELRLVVDAAQTPSFLTDKRVVVARGVDRFTADDLAPLLGYLADPLDSSDLVIVINSGSVPKKLGDAVKAIGTVSNTSPPSRPKDRQEWISEHIKEAGLRIRPDAAAQLAGWLGEDAGRLDGILATLTSTYGAGDVLTFAEIEPFLGDAGGVPPWDFTDAIDAGDTTKALTLLGRMMHAGGRHPLQIMAILHSHYANVAKLDGADARSEQDAMAATGIKSPYPAKKALANYRRLGPASTKRAIELLAQADLDLRGDKDLEPELVMEVLVARLSKLRR